MLWTYEDGDYNSSVSMEIDSDDIKYDAEYMNIFMEQLTDDVKWYVDRARALEKSYVKFQKIKSRNYRVNFECFRVVLRLTFPFKFLLRTRI